MKEEMMEIRDMIRRQYHVYGRVQGVGFRYTVTQAADALGLTGWKPQVEYPVVSDGESLHDLRGGGSFIP